MESGPPYKEPPGAIMSSALEVAVFTVGPIVVMGATIIYILAKTHDLDDKRPLFLVVLLLLMVLHQITEVAQLADGTFYRTVSPSAETFESSANLLTCGASYFVLQQITELRRTRTELETSNNALEERSSMVTVLNRILRHNVRNDVNIIAGHAEYVRHDIDGDRFAQELVTIEQTALDLATISDRTRRVRRLIEETPTGETEHTLIECLRPPIDRVRNDHPAATITFDVPVGAEPVVTAPASFPTAVADVVERIITSNDGAVAVEITLVDHRRATGEPSAPVRIRIDDDAAGLPELDVQAIESEEETALKHAEGITLWCLKWVVQRAGGELDMRRDDATVEVALPESG